MTDTAISNDDFRDTLERQLRPKLKSMLERGAASSGPARTSIAVLGRAAGKRFGDDTAASSTFLRVFDVPQSADSSEHANWRLSEYRIQMVQNAFSVATLFAATRPTTISRQNGSFASACRALRAQQQDGEAEDWVTRRFKRLLELQEGELSADLVRIGRRLGPEAMAKVDPARLFQDIVRWGERGSRTRVQWSIDLWGTRGSDLKTENNDSQGGDSDS